MPARRPRRGGGRCTSARRPRRRSGRSTSDAGVVVEGVEPPQELPLHGLGVGLVGREHVLAGDPGLGALAHLLEAVLARTAGARVRAQRPGGAFVATLAAAIDAVRRFSDRDDAPPVGLVHSFLRTACTLRTLSGRDDSPPRAPCRRGLTAMSGASATIGRKPRAGRLPLVAMVVGVKLVWHDVHLGHDARRHDRRPAHGARRPRHRDRLPRQPHRELRGRRPRRDARDPRAAALLVARLEHLPRDGHRPRGRGRARHARGVRVPAAVLPGAAPDPHRRDDRRHRDASSRSASSCPSGSATAKTSCSTRRSSTCTSRSARAQQHELLRQRRADAHRRADRSCSASSLFFRSPSIGIALRALGRERRPRVAARHPGAPAPERRVGTRRAPRVRRDVPAHRRGRPAARAGARPDPAAQRARRGGDRPHGAAADGHVRGDRARHRVAGRALPLLVGGVPLGR